MKYNITIIFAAILLTLTACGDTPIFSEMSSNRLRVVIKGTLETEEISHFTNLNSLTANNSAVQDSGNSYDSVDDVVSPGEDALPTTFMFDIAELRLDNEKFANYRQIFEVSLAGDGSSEPFFNGTGVELKNDDPAEDHYDTVKLYIRKMIFDNAMIYQSTGDTLTYEDPAEVIFKENDRKGFDFNQLQVNSYWDSLREESSDYLRNFPLKIPIIGGFEYDKNNKETVLEIRIVIKNFIKKYEYDYYDSGVFKVCHYYAFSDWLRDVRAGESDIGRNIHAVARAYVPGKTGTVTVTAAAGNYVIAIPSTEPISDYSLTQAGNSIRNLNPCDLPQPPSDPGSYIEAVLDYYLKYEKYKYDWNNIASSAACDTLSEYETAWDTYEAAVENYKIAPYIGYSTGTVTFSNMAPGSYNFYLASKPSYGALFLVSDITSTPINGSTPVSVKANSTITVP